MIAVVNKIFVQQIIPIKTCLIGMVPVQGFVKFEENGTGMYFVE